MFSLLDVSWSVKAGKIIDYLVCVRKCRETTSCCLATLDEWLWSQLAHPVVSRQHNYWRIIGRQLLGFLKPCLGQWDFPRKTCTLGWQVIRRKYGTGYIYQWHIFKFWYDCEVFLKSLVCILGIFVLQNLLFKTNFFNIVYWALF